MRLRRSKTPEAPTVDYAFCEPVWATTSSRTHIRLVEGGRKLGGGIDSPALCGFDLARGWDLPRNLDAGVVSRTLDSQCNPTCPACAAAWVARTHADQDQP
jgi:hypothetical protein